MSLAGNFASDHFTETALMTIESGDGNATLPIGQETQLQLPSLESAPRPSQETDVSNVPDDVARISLSSDSSKAAEENVVCFIINEG